MNTVRKSITITKVNQNYIEKLIKQKKTKNFSRAINEAVDQRRENDERETHDNRN